METLLNILFSLTALGALGALFGLSLALAQSKPNKGEAESLLPGLDCGVCGYPGCASYAHAVMGKKAAPDLCAPGGEKTAKTLAKLPGVEVSYTEELMVQVHCRGGRDTSKYVFSYRGLDDCTALFLLFGGDKECKFSCLGQGSCIKVCPEEAIYRDEKNLIRVDGNRCTGCGACTAVCPTGVLRPLPKNADVLVACNSTDDARKVTAYCSVGCTGCRACEKRSPEGGFHVDQNLARINYRRRGDRSGAVLACDPKCIVSNQKNAKA